MEENKEIKEIGAKTFMKMFMAISYLHEQIYFNLVELTGYLWEKYAFEPEVFDQMDEAFSEMIDDGVITKVEDTKSLYQINGGINYIRIMEDNAEYRDDMLEFFYNYYDKSSKVNIHIIPKSRQK